jgi:hypothetical protein
MKKSKQTDVILNHLLNGETLNINSAYKITKRECKLGFNETINQD